MQSIKLFFLIALHFIVGSANAACGRVYNAADTTILFVNGIQNDREAACRSSDVLKVKLQAQGLDINTNNFDYFHNPNAWLPTDVNELSVQANISNDALSEAERLGYPGNKQIYYKLLGESYISKIASHPSSHKIYGITQMLYDTVILLTGNNKKLVVVAHSQGNFFIEAVYGMLVKNAETVGSAASALQGLRIVGAGVVANSSPSSRWISSSEDKALNIMELNNEPLRSHFTVLPRNKVPCILDGVCGSAIPWIDIGPFTGYGDTMAHSFIDVYLSQVIYDQVSQDSFASYLTSRVIGSIDDLQTQFALSDDFLGSAIDSTKWTVIGLGDGNSPGTPSVANSLITFPQSTRLSTEGKKTITGGKIVIESRMVGLESSRDTGIYLVDTMETGASVGNSIWFGDSSYYSAMYAGAYGIYSNPAPYLLVTSGTSTNRWMEYRLTIDGDRVTIERGLTLSQIDPSQTRTFTLARSIVGRSFFLNIGTGGPAYSPGTFDWVRVTTTP